jgi:hypothetical protein
MRNVYRSLIYKTLDTYVMVDGVKTLIPFRGGSLQPPVNGIFVTDNPNVIKAMNKDSGYGTSFICISSEGDPEPEKAPEKTAPEKEAPKAPEVAEKKTVPGITNLQEAKEYLLKNIEGLKLANMPNTKSVKNLMAKNGFEFPDLVI